MIYIYTDGACSGNPGHGGSAFIVVENEEKIYEFKLEGDKLSLTPTDPYSPKYPELIKK